MKRFVLILLSLILVNVAVADAKKVDQVTRDDINGDGITETIFRGNYSGGSGGTFYEVSIKQPGREIFNAGLSELSSLIIFRDVNKRFKGKEIIIIEAIPTTKYDKDFVVEVSWFGWDINTKRYSLYNINQSKKKYDYANLANALKEFPTSGEEGPIYDAIILSRKAINALRLGNFDEAIGYCDPEALEGSYGPAITETMNDKAYKSNYFLPRGPGFLSYSNYIFGNVIQLWWSKPSPNQYCPELGLLPVIIVYVNNDNKISFIGPNYCGQ